MDVMLVPSSIASGVEEASQYLISYLINETLAVDAGSLGVYGTPQDQARIRHVLISHTHLDHTATLPTFIENAYEGRADCVTIHGSDAVLKSLQDDIFNDRVWPDFVALSSGPSPFVKLGRLEPGRPVELEGLRITPVEVNHIVPTLGFLIDNGVSAIVIASDTGPTVELWRLANSSDHLKAVYLEASFPNAMHDLAMITKHMTPAMLGTEVLKLTRPATIVAVHIKTRFRAQIVSELTALGLPNLEIGRFGTVASW